MRQQDAQHRTGSSRARAGRAAEACSSWRPTAKPTPTTMNIRPDQKSFWLLIFTHVSSPHALLRRDSRQATPQPECGLHVASCEPLARRVRRSSHGRLGRARPALDAGYSQGGVQRSTSSSVVTPSATFIAPARRSGRMPSLQRLLAQLRRRRAPGGSPARAASVIDQQFVQAGAAAVAGHAALEAAHRLVRPHAAGQAPGLDDLVERLARGRRRRAACRPGTACAPGAARARRSRSRRSGRAARPGRSAA